MNFAELQQTIQNCDEVLTIGKNAYISARGGDGNGESKGTRCYIAGMAREGNQAHLYILTENAADKNRPVVCGGTNRERMKIHTEPDVLMEIAAVKVGETEFITKGITGYPPGHGIPSAECGFFAGKSGEELWVTQIDVELAGNTDGKSVADIAYTEDRQKTEDETETVKLGGSDCKRLPSW